MTEDDIRTQIAPHQHKLGGTIHALHQLMRAYGYIHPEHLPVVADTFNIIDNGHGAVDCHKLGGKGYINHTVDIHPPHDLRVWELCENKQYEEAQALLDSVNGPLDKVYEKVGARTGGQSVVKKGLTAAMGRSCGPSRPPSGNMNEEEMDLLREVLTEVGWPVPSSN